MFTSRAFAKGLLSSSPSLAESVKQDWGLAQMAGRLVEISGERASANLTVAIGLVLEAQQRGEHAAWVTLRHSTFFPPDVAACGVSLRHLVTVRVETLRDATRAVVELTRSGGFDLVVLDRGPEALVGRSFSRLSKKKQYRERFSTPLLTKLAGLARKHRTAVVVLTEKNERASSLSSLISLRAETKRDKDEPCRLEIHLLKDKRRGPGRRHHEVCHAPDGLR